MTGRPVPERVQRAQAAAERSGFPLSCVDGHGRLLASLAAAAQGAVGETGTGCGVGTAWLRSGLRDGLCLITVEDAAERATTAATLFADDPAVTVLHSDWRVLADHGPFHLLFADGGFPKDEPDAACDLVVAGGVVVMDDFTPSDAWPPIFEGQPDSRRLAWFHHPAFVTVDVQTAPGHVSLIATRR